MEVLQLHLFLKQLRSLLLDFYYFLKEKNKLSICGALEICFARKDPFYCRAPVTELTFSLNKFESIVLFISLLLKLWEFLDVTKPEVRNVIYF